MSSKSAMLMVVFVFLSMLMIFSSCAKSGDSAPSEPVVPADTTTPTTTAENTTTETRTFTATATNTATDTNTNIPTETLTNTTVYTSTETATITDTNTFTATSTYTHTATPTHTNTATSTMTPTTVPTSIALIASALDKPAWYAFQSGVDAWAVDTTIYNYGTSSVSLGPISNGQLTTIGVKVNVTGNGGGHFGFDWRIVADAADYIEVGTQYIDGGMYTTQFRRYGNEGTAWDTIGPLVFSKGEYYVFWTFYDLSPAAGGKAWIDDLTLSNFP
jgi:hypothetical protein